MLRAVEQQGGGQPRGGRTFTVRAIALGALLAATVCGVTPYNDYVVVNTFMVGSYLPLALMLTALLFVMAGNGMYRWLAPRRAFQTGELALIFLMLLVACSVPAQGLFRGLLPSIVSPFWYGQTDPTFWRGFQSADLPRWLFPVPSIADGPRSDEIRYFFGRVPAGTAIPYAAWLVPLLTWGVYVGAVMLTLVSLAALLRIQWAEHERLPFPLAKFELALIESPEPGQLMNALFRTKGFWIAVGAVLIVHLFNGLHTYDPRWPEIYRSYDLRPIMSEEPWRFVPDTLKTAPIYFTFIGMAYFIRGRVALSLWLIYVITQLYAAGRAAVQFDVPPQQWGDQHIGACVAFAVGMTWTGRHFFGRSLRAAIFGQRGRISVESPGDRLLARWAMRGLVVGLAGMIGWLLVIGASPWLALATVFFVLLGHVTTSRLLAETGMPYVRTSPSVIHLITALPATAVSARTTLIGGMFWLNGAFQAREGLLGLSQHGLQVVEESDSARRTLPRARRRVVGLIAVIAGTLLLSYVVSACSHLHAYYSYATPLSPRLNRSVLNEDVLLGHTATYIRDPLVQQQGGAFAQRGYSPGLHAGIGFVITIALQLLTWRFAAWPLPAIGYLMSGTTFINLTWFSILLGASAKSALLRIGGPRLLESARPAFIGLIFGESVAAALWMIVNLWLASRGYDYRPYAALPL